MELLEPFHLVVRGLAARCSFGALETQDSTRRSHREHELQRGHKRFMPVDENTRGGVWRSAVLRARTQVRKKGKYQQLGELHLAALAVERFRSKLNWWGQFGADIGTVENPDVDRIADDRNSKG